MHCCRWLAASVGIASVVLLAAWAQPEPKSKTPPAAPVAQPDPAAEQAAWMEFMTPGEHHAFLAKFTGTWTAAAKFWMAPGEPATEGTGTMLNEMILGGRYLRSTYTGEMMGMPFEGISQWGFNNQTGKYQSTWIDSFGTAITSSEGSANADGSRFEMRGEMDDPTTKAKTKQKEIFAWVNANTHTMTVFNLLADGTELKTMEITYTRAAAAKPEPAQPATAPHGS